jgi:hypothetical protein
LLHFKCAEEEEDEVGIGIGIGIGIDGTGLLELVADADAGVFFTILAQDIDRISYCCYCNLTNYMNKKKNLNQFFYLVRINSFNHRSKL